MTARAPHAGASSLAARLARTRERVRAAAVRSGRDPDAVRILAVSKTFALDRVLEAADADQRAFGESRVQEAESKVEGARAAGRALEWHLIGRLQRNKAGRACALFDVIHSVDRVELAEALSRHAGERSRPLRVFLQVDLDGEPQKGGAAPGAVAGLLARVADLPGLEPVGLMAIPRAQADPERARPSFARLRSLAEELRLQAPAGAKLRELSMGMSHDFEVAIEEGATWVRIGSAIFGEREAQ